MWCAGVRCVRVWCANRGGEGGCEYSQEVLHPKVQPPRPLSPPRKRGGGAAYAPPEQLPPDTVSIFTDGSALYDKTRRAWVEAGFGLTAITDGAGHEHAGGCSIHEHCGPIHVGDEGVEGLTNNVAEVVAFIHAMRYARTVGDRPVCFRYDSKYAALITVGVYKAKKEQAARTPGANRVEAHRNSQAW